MSESAKKAPTVLNYAMKFLAAFGIFILAYTGFMVIFTVATGKTKLLTDAAITTGEKFEFNDRIYNCVLDTTSTDSLNGWRNK